MSVADLEALEREITQTHIEAVVAESRPEDLKRPEVAAIIQMGVSMATLLSERDGLLSEAAFLRQQLASSQARATQLETTLDEAIAQRDYFRTACDGMKETLEAQSRIAERGLALARHAYPETYRQRRAADSLPPTTNARPSDVKVTSIKTGRTIQR